MLLPLLTCLLGGAAMLAVIFYLYFSRNFDFWKRLGVPYIKPSLFFGSLGPAFVQRVDVAHHLKTFYEAHRDTPYVGFFAFDRPALLINDLDLVKNVLVKDAQNFIDHVIDIDKSVDPLFGRMLFSLKGERWRHVRVNLTPVFTSGKMKKMFHLVKICSDQLLQHLEKITADGKPVPIKETMSRYTTDVISSCAFGIDSNTLSNPNAEVRLKLRKFFDYSVMKGVASMFMMFAPALQNFFGLRFLDSDASNFLRSTVWNTVDYREKNGVVRRDFLENMIELRKGSTQDKTNGVVGDKFKIDGDTFIAQCFAFYFGGFESSGSTLTFALYELALRPDIQARLREEIVQVLARHDNQVTYDAIQEITYLDMVISETLRLRPVLGFLDRVCVKDYQIPHPSGKGQITLPAGTPVYISMLGIHHNPDIYPEPYKFDPERFTEENKQKRPGVSHLPFGEGPRICIGMRFGLLQVKVALSNVLMNYEVTPSKDTPIPLIYDKRTFLLQTRTEIPLTFKKILA
ncbi:cytochrome P450 6j1-like [Periplaneta americana]|uniref:cytochrome P450 6j1-like n=1 Tax=Periplaneta americana TaxID=6978 RepID=UPI0037E993C7